MCLCSCLLGCGFFLFFFLGFFVVFWVGVAFGVFFLSSPFSSWFGVVEGFGAQCSPFLDELWMRACQNGLNSSSIDFLRMRRRAPGFSPDSSELVHEADYIIPVI